MMISLNVKKAIVGVVLMMALALGFGTAYTTVYAADTTTEVTQEAEEAAAETEEDADDGVGMKAAAAAFVVGLAALGGALAMGNTVSKACEGISRQPEAEGKIRSSMMLGLVFVETAIIYALIVAILIIFVM